MSAHTSREEQVFADALGRPEHERSAFVDGACNGDVALRDRVIALLKAHTGTNSLLNSGAVTVSALHEEKPGDHIARYKLLQKLGEGGCGVVWMAEQEEPVRRRVALKIIKLGMDTKAVVARFEAERQALAMMDHPNIAKVHDAGATQTGRPYFVMELVRGIPITKYCDENHLTPTARLELFIKVCQAVQHAHQKGIIHRDIKPSNILVTVNDGAPTPKVIDFGIAKATQGKLTDATVFTAFEQFIGTPVYMCPEQAEMSSLDIDTRADIYSLGVLLYELLTGRPPFDPKKFAQAGVDQIRKQIREVEPPRPSARLSTLDADERTTIAHLRGTAAANLSIILRGDLDWIVMRCIEKDRTRRYDTANGLAMDIQRYLRNEPVVARPPSTAYLLQKLIRRHRVGFAAGLIVLISVIAGLTFSTLSFLREKVARQRAESAEVTAQSSRAAARQSEELAQSARSNAEKLLSFVLTDLSEQLQDLGQILTLEHLSENAVAYYEGLPDALRTGDTRAGYALALASLGRVRRFRADFQVGQEYTERARSMAAELAASSPGPFARVALGNVFHSLMRQTFNYGQFLEVVRIGEQAETLLRPALTDPQWAGWAQRTLIQIVHQKGYALMRAERISAAVMEFRRALANAEDAERRWPSPRWPTLRRAHIMASASEAFHSGGLRSEAREMTATAHARLRELIEKEPLLLAARVAFAFVARDVAMQARAQWKFPETLSAMEEARREWLELQEINPHNRIGYRNNYAITWSESQFAYDWLHRDFDAAEADLRKGIEELADSVAQTPFMRGNLLIAHYRYALLCAATGREDEVGRRLRTIEELQERVVEERRLSRAERELNGAIEDGPGKDSWFSPILRRDIEFHRLNWRALRRLAEEALGRLAALEVEKADEERRSIARRLAHRDLMRAAFELGDHTTARRELDAWAPVTQPLPADADIQQRFDHIGNQLMRIHVVARGGERESARAELAKIWPEVDDVLAAGPDYHFNQVQYARALLIRAELDGTPAEKRAWLERATGYLRRAALAGRLTRYEREVLLAGIEKQLTAPAP